MGSVGMEHGLSCPTACGILVPWPGIEPKFPALEGRFLTSGPPGKFHYGWCLKSPKMSMYIFLYISQVECFFLFPFKSLKSGHIPWWPSQESPVFLTWARSFGCSGCRTIWFHKTRREKKAYSFPLLQLIKKVLALRFFTQTLLLYFKITKFKGPS